MDGLRVPSANDFLKTSFLPGSIARLTLAAIVRNEEWLISAGSKAARNKTNNVYNAHN
jgi:hypothetical protein